MTHTPLTTQDKHVVGDYAGPLYTWWRGDPLPGMPPLPGFTTGSCQDIERLATVTGLPEDEIQHRLAEGHRPYLAQLGSVPVACGWVATAHASIGALGLTFSIPSGNRYLWDFVTFPEWRGRGMYPRLLQAIMSVEREATRFWIGHDAGNTPSARGIAKAGFVVVGEIFWRPDRSLVMVPVGDLERAQAGASLLRIPLLEPLP